MKSDVIVIGSGMSGMTAACLLAKEGFKVTVLEQNWIVGGCTSSYWRKGYVFESGATTLVGLDKNMPLEYLLETLGIDIPAVHLDLPMQVWLKNGQIINRYQDIRKWINEAENIFGAKNQRSFWELCYQISQFVWETSLKQTSFPPTSWTDLKQVVKGFDFRQLKFAPYSLMSVEKLLKKFNLHQNADFVDFVNEQLLITAQNLAHEVNVLFGATALCYTNYANYYVNGGLINLVNPLVDYLKSKGGDIYLKNNVLKVSRVNNQYRVETKTMGKELHNIYWADYLIAAIPLNNVLQIFDKEIIKKNISQKIMPSSKLNSAFQVGVGFVKKNEFQSIHHQVHLKKPLPQIGSKSVFVSFNHPKDFSRSDFNGHGVASISTHLPHPESNSILDKSIIEESILERLEEIGLLEKSQIQYLHSSTSKSWQKWTGRMFGFVGGYPQYLKIKPWQMNEARLDNTKAYLCGDTAYPGQGIPGVTLSGIIAYQKLKNDWM
ncbi:MAG: C-3',4' desaturase CrtD [Flammeovirgaceae bacterium]